MAADAGVELGRLIDETSLMEDSERWPWPTLPLKRSAGAGGFSDGQLVDAWELGYLCRAADGKVLPEVTFTADERRRRYDSFEAIYEDGWRVD